MLVRSYFGNQDADGKRNLKYLMWLSIINLAITASHDSFRYISDQIKRGHNFQLAPIIENNVSQVVTFT